jgi:hypothetical protein
MGNTTQRAERTGGAAQPRGDQKAESGLPGGGKGRVDRTGKSGVYPASGPLPKGDAEIRTPAAWGQGERGAAGYTDHGDSEVPSRKDYEEFGTPPAEEPAMPAGKEPARRTSRSDRTK